MCTSLPFRITRIRTSGQLSFIARKENRIGVFVSILEVATAYAIILG